MAAGNLDTGGLSRRDFVRLAGAGGLALAAGPALAADAPGKMHTSPIPSSGEAMPVVGVGTWQTFDIGKNPEDRAKRREVLRLLFEAGGSIIDSSPMYGRSEGVVGELLAEMGARDQAFLATKVWTEGRERGIAQMKQSMARFQSDRIELMQVHNLVDWRTHLKTLRDWKAAGTFRYIGITHYTTSSLESLAQIIETEGIDFVQMAYSIGVRAAEARLLPTAAEHGVAVIVNRPYEGGSLFRRAGGRELPPWAAELDCASWGQFFLKFILGHPAVTCVIPGTGKPEHMRDNRAAGFGRLPDEAERRRMADFYETL